MAASTPSRMVTQAAKWAKFSTGPRRCPGCAPPRRTRVIHRAIIDTPKPTVTS
jgi:hypothetical protein